MCPGSTCIGCCHGRRWKSTCGPVSAATRPQSGRTLPGLRMPSGSSASLMARMTATTRPDLSLKVVSLRQTGAVLAADAPPSASTSARVGARGVHLRLHRGTIGAGHVGGVVVAVAGMAEDADLHAVPLADPSDGVHEFRPRLRGTLTSSVRAAPACSIDQWALRRASRRASALAGSLARVCEVAPAAAQALPAISSSASASAPPVSDSIINAPRPRVQSQPQGRLDGPMTWRSSIRVWPAQGRGSDPGHRVTGLTHAREEGQQGHLGRRHRA